MANPYLAIRRSVSQQDAPGSEAAPKHILNVETNHHKANFPKQINHCGKEACFNTLEDLLIDIKNYGKHILSQQIVN